MERVTTRSAKDKKNLCRTYRDYGIDIRKPKLDEWGASKVVREAVRMYRFTEAKPEEIVAFIQEEMNKLSTISTVTTENHIRQAREIITRYISFDSRRMKEAYPFHIPFKGVELIVTPDYLNKEVVKTEFFLEEVPVVDVITVSSGRPYYGDTSKIRGTSSVYHNLETLGNILYGKRLLKGKKGVVRVVYDWLKTNYDRYGDYSRPFSAAVPGHFTKGGENNRLILEIPFDENGEIISTYNRRLEKLMGNYEVALKDYLNGICEDEISKGTCEECELYDRCKGYSKRPEPKEKDKKVLGHLSREDFDISNEQMNVIGARKGVFCVDAGPGSGKTFSVALRIADMIVEGAYPEDFLLVSFSNSAVKVLRERARYFLNEVYQMDVDIDQMAIATFHSLAYDIVSDNFQILGFRERPRLIDDVEAIDLVRSAIDWLDPIEGFDYTNPLMRFGSGGVVPNLYKIFTDIKAFNLTKEEFEKRYISYDYITRNKIWETFTRFQKLMEDSCFIDYSDMENMTERLIHLNPNLITDKLDYKHIIVDEFQDSNDFQMLFINTLSLSPSFVSLMVIGDEAQAIYSFRGTSPDNFNCFDEKMGLDDVKNLTLTINRRSTPEIVDFSNQVIAINGGKHKVMASVNKSIGEEVVFMDFEKSSTELPWIAERIAELLSKGTKPSDIAFIAHKKSTLTRLQGLLSENGILALFDQPEELISDPKVKAIISLVMFLRDSTATKGIFDYMCELKGNQIMNEPDIQEMIEQEAERLLNKIDLAPEEDRRDILINLMDGLREETDSLYEAFYERILAKTYTYSGLLEYIYKFYKYESSATAEKIEEYEAVSLVTAHSSKGKEWKNVFVSLTDFDSGQLSWSEMPEKIRLAYVACTRAEDRLTVTCSKYRKTEIETEINRFWRIFERLTWSKTEEMVS